MTPPNSTPSYGADLYKCPHCGALKVLRSAYGYPFSRGVHWSDTKHYYPDIHRTSYVQRCPACKKYYFRTDEALYKTDIHCTRDVAWGRLSYHSLREAFVQLSPTGKEERQMRLMLLHAHNDLYGGCGGTRPQAEATREEQEFFRKNANALITLANIDDPYDRLLIAELYREMGQFDEAIGILRAVFDYRLYLGLEVLRTQILERAESCDSRVFVADGDKNCSRKAIITDDVDYIYDEDFGQNHIDKDYLPF